MVCMHIFGLPCWGPGCVSTPPIISKVLINEDPIIVNVIIRARHVAELVLFLVNVDISVILCLLCEPMLIRQASTDIMVPGAEI